MLWRKLGKLGEEGRIIFKKIIDKCGVKFCSEFKLGVWCSFDLL
jgi:hypothetical protein